MIRNKVKASKTTLLIKRVTQGETIEAKVRRITRNNQKIEDGAPNIFQERKDGVKAEHNIRTDRWELAVEAMDKVAQAQIAKREENPGKPDEAVKPQEGSVDPTTEEPKS